MINLPPVNLTGQRVPLKEGIRPHSEWFNFSMGGRAGPVHFGAQSRISLGEEIGELLFFSVLHTHVVLITLLFQYFNKKKNILSLTVLYLINIAFNISLSERGGPASFTCFTYILMSLIFFFFYILYVV